MVPEALQRFVRAAADFATNGKLGKLEFAQDARGRPDISAFDFTSMLRAECSARVQEKHGARLLLGLVGDCLVEVRPHGLCHGWGRKPDGGGQGLLVEGGAPGCLVQVKAAGLGCFPSPSRDFGKLPLDSH